MLAIDVEDRKINLLLLFARLLARRRRSRRDANDLDRELAFARTFDANERDGHGRILGVGDVALEEMILLASGGAEGSFEEVGAHVPRDAHALFDGEVGGVEGL